MSAKEMFEKLEYKQEKDGKIHITYYNGNFENKQRCDKQITFDLESKNFIAYSPYELNDYEDCSIFINMQELQAINKQVEELGWLGSDDNE